MKSLRIALCAGALLGAEVRAQYLINTFAGGGPPDGTPAMSVALGNGSPVATDAAGNVYVGALDRIFKVTPAGVVSTVAGNGVLGYSGDNGPAPCAMLNGPGGLAVDGSGDLYIADVSNHRIRKVSGGIITTVAGTGSSGSGGDGGPAVNAGLFVPMDVAVDRDGNLYIADTLNNRVRKVSGGIITTVAGSGSFPTPGGYSGDGGAATSAQLNSPCSVAVDAAGTLYIADCNNHRIRRVSGGIITTVAGNGTAGDSGDGGPATGAQIGDSPRVAVDAAGSLYISGSHRIRKVSAGIITTVAGSGSQGYSGDGGPAADAQLSYPWAIALNRTGDLYISDGGNSRVRKVSAGIITTIAGNGSFGYSGEGGPPRNAQLQPDGVAVDSAGAIFIANSSDHRVLKVSGGTITAVAGNGSGGELGDGGPATSAQLASPQGLAVDGAGNLYICDLGTSRIRKVSGGIITTVAGNGSYGFSGDGGPATDAALQGPQAVAVDASGNLYIVDGFNHRIRKVSGGVISTVAGNGAPGYSGDGGVATNAQLNWPTGIAIDSAGNLYIADRSKTASVRCRAESSLRSPTTLLRSTWQ